MRARELVLFDPEAPMELARAVPFVERLGEDFYADVDAIRDAISPRTEFNVIFQPAIFEIDVFVPALDLVVRRELARARVLELGPATFFEGNGHVWASLPEVGVFELVPKP